MLVVGVDGCSGGWIALAYDTERREVSPHIFTGPQAFRDLLDTFSEASCIAIDIPIGLAEDQPRQADVDARRVLGSRRSSVFPAPDPRLVDASSYSEASSRARSLLSKGVSQQAFAIYPKVAEVNRAMTPMLQQRVIEVHPEVCFWAMAQRNPMEYPKKDSQGFIERRKLLLASLPGISVPDRQDAGRFARPAKADDVLDAFAATWTALRFSEGKAERLPSDPELDSRGLRMEMVF